MTYTGYHTAQKRRARRGDRPLERAFVATKLGEVRTKTNAEKWRKGKEKKKKERNKQTKQGAFPFSTVQSAASQGCQWKSDARNRRGPRSARQCRRARSPIQDAAAVVAAAPLFLRFLSLSEVSAPPLPPSPPPEPRRSSLSLLRRCVPWSVVSASRCCAGCSPSLRTTCSGGGSSIPAGLRNLRGTGLWLIRDRLRLG